jgi:hypothetical protein
MVIKMNIYEAKICYHAVVLVYNKINEALYILKINNSAAYNPDNEDILLDPLFKMYQQAEKEYREIAKRDGYVLYMNDIGEYDYMSKTKIGGRVNESLSGNNESVKGI